MRLRACLIFLAMMCTQAGFGLAETYGDALSITWMHADFPPLRITQGPFAGQGPSDMIHDLMQRELPQFEHHVVTSNLSRTLKWLEEGRHVLAVGLIPSVEREKIAIFSDPCVLVPPVCLVVSKTMREGMGHGRTSLRAFLSRYQLGVAVDRSYGPEIDALLRDPSLSGRLVPNPGSTLFEKLLSMLRLERVDGVLGYPFEAVYVARSLGVLDDIALIPLNEAMLPLIGRVAAPRTPWGEAMMQRVNLILRAHRNSTAYRNAFERWITPEILDDYRAMYQDVMAR